MVTESFAIIAVIAVMMVMYLRAGKGQMAGLAAPLLTLPVAHLVVSAIWGMPRMHGGGYLSVRVGILVASTLVGGLLCLLLARKISSAKGKTGYLLFTLSFLIALAIAYILYLI